MNKGEEVVNLVLKSGRVALHKGETIEMPVSVYKALLCVFPRLVVVEEPDMPEPVEEVSEPAESPKPSQEVVVEAEPVEIEEVKKTTEKKNAKGKKSRK